VLPHDYSVEFARKKFALMAPLPGTPADLLILLCSLQNHQTTVQHFLHLIGALQWKQSLQLLSETILGDWYLLDLV
jgi:hypothetical protein